MFHIKNRSLKLKFCQRHWWYFHRVTQSPPEQHFILVWVVTFFKVETVRYRRMFAVFGLVRYGSQFFTFPFSKAANGTRNWQTVSCHFCHPSQPELNLYHKEGARPPAVRWLGDRIVTCLRRLGRLCPGGVQLFLFFVWKQREMLDWTPRLFYFGCR